MPKAKANSERINVFFSPEILNYLKAEAEKKGSTVSGIIRMIVMEYVANQQK